MRSAQLCASELKATLRDATHVGSSTTSSCASSALWGRTGGAAGSPRAVASSKWRGKGEGRRSTNAKRSAVRKHVAGNAPRCEARRQQLDIERRSERRTGENGGCGMWPEARGFAQAALHGRRHEPQERRKQRCRGEGADLTKSRPYRQRLRTPHAAMSKHVESSERAPPETRKSKENRP